MPVHLVIITYLADLDVIDATIAEHGAWLDKNYADGVFLASGRQEPRTGGVILADGLTLEGLNERLALDPFQQQGLAEYRVITFTPSKTAPGLERLLPTA